MNLEDMEFNLMNLWPLDEFMGSAKYLRLHAGANRINAPIPCVIVVKMYFPEPYSWVPLSCTIEKAMVNGDSNTPVLDMTGIGTDQHGFVMIVEPAPV